jgi:hypothetical protein
MAGKLKIRELITKWSFKSDSKPVVVLDKAVNGLKKTVGFATKGLAVFGAGAIGAGVGVFALVQKVAVGMDKIAKLSTRVGVTSKTLQKLKHAAELSGTSLDEMVTGMRRLAAAAFDATKGSKSAKEAFSELGIEVKQQNGDLKKNETLLRETLIAMSQMTDKTKRAALAQKLFGRAGTSLLPMLQGGAFGITKMMKEAEDLGLVMTDKAMKGAEDFNDEMLRLKAMIGGFAAKFASSLMPIISKWIKSMKDWVKENKKLIDQELPKIAQGIADGVREIFKNVKISDVKKFLSGIAGFFKGLSKVINGVATAFKWIGKAIAFVGDKIGWLAAKFAINFNQVRGMIKGIWVFVQVGAKGAVDAVSGFFKKIGAWFAELPGRASASMGAVWKSITGAFKGAAAAVNEFFGGIWGWLSALPSKIWDSLVGGFWTAIENVKKMFVDAFNWLKSKLGGKFMDIALGGTVSKVEIAVATVTKATAAATGAPSVIAPPGAPPAKEGANVSYAPQIQVMVPPGTDASLAERVAESTQTATSNTFRRAIGNIQR